MPTINFTGTGGTMEGDLGTSDVTLNLDPSLTFDGAADYLTVAEANFRTDDAQGAITAWVKTTSSAGQIILSAADTATTNFAQYVYLSSGYVYAEQLDAGSAIYSIRTATAGEVSDGSWHHIAVVSTGTAIIIYIDGVASTLTVVSGTNNGDWFGDMTDSVLDNVTIGVLTRTSSEAYFNGELADIRYYVDAITATEVKVLASKINVDASEMDNLRHHWKLNNTTINAANLGEDTGSVGLDLTPTSIVAGSFNYDEYAINVQDTATTDGAVTITTGKLEGKALSCASFDGTGDLVNVGDSSNIITGTNVTYACWCKVATAHTASAYIIANQKGAGSTNMSLAVNRDDGGAATGFVSGLLWNGSTHIFAKYDADINDSLWHHIVYTTTGSSQKLYLDGVQVATGSGAFSNAASSDDMSIGGFNAGTPSDSLNGNLRDVRIYDYALSADQAASLYSGSYPATSDHWWKMDEGTGTSAGDTGTGTTRNSTAFAGNAALGDDNGTLDLDGSFNISANGTMSAPRGKVQVAGDFQPAGIWTHNNGTLETNNTSEADFDINASTALYNWIHDGTTMTIEPATDGHTIIEKSLIINSGKSLKPQDGADVTFGTSSQVCTVTNNGTFANRNNNNTVTFKGASSLYPFAYEGTDFDWDHDATAGNIQNYILSNCNWNPDITTGAYVNIQLAGDCEFDAFTVSANSTLDVNGQRMECSGNFINSGTVNYGGSPAMVIAGRFVMDSQSDEEAGANFIVSGGSADSNNDFDIASFIADDTTNIFINNGTTSVDWTSSRYYVGNLITGSAFKSQQATENICGSITIPTGGTLDGDNDIITCKGDLTTSGGLLGAGCFSFDGVKQLEEASATVVGLASHHTVEFWFRGTANQSYTQALLYKHNSFWMYQTNAEKIGVAWRVSGAWSSITSSTTAVLNKWYHVAATYNDTTKVGSLYIDGKLEVTKTHAASPADSAVLNIGNEREGSVTNFFGQMDEIRFWKETRTVAEIRAGMFTEYPTDSNSKLFIQFSANTGTGSAVTDTKGGMTDVSGIVSATEAVTTDIWGAAGAFDGSDAACLLKMANTTFTDATCDTAGTTTVTCDSSSSIKVGQNVSGAGIPVATSVIAVNSAGSVTSFTLSQAATRTLTNTTLTFNGRHINYTGDETIGHLHIDAGHTTLNEITGVGTDTFTCASVLIDSGTTFTSTAGTLTVTSEASSYAWTNSEGDAGFTHNNGTVIITNAGDTQIKENRFNNLTINLDSSTTDITWRDTTGNALKVWGDLTITRGRLLTSSTSDTIDIYGLTYVAVTHATLWNDADQDTNKITHHGLVTNFGTYKINDATTVKMNGGITSLQHQSPKLTHRY